jgi:hypothetical protein
MSAGFAGGPAQARDLLKTLSDPPSKVWQTTNHPDLKFCVITSLAARTGQASTVVEKGPDTVIIVHNWSSPVPGDDVRAILRSSPVAVSSFVGKKRNSNRRLTAAISFEVRHRGYVNAIIWI